MEETSVYGIRLPTPLRDFLTGNKGPAFPGSVPSLEHAAVVAALAAVVRKRPVFLVAPDSRAVERVSGLARYLLEHGPEPYDFPRWPTVSQSPYEQVVESPFVAAARLGAMAACALAESPFLMVIDAARAATRVIPFENFAEGLQRVQSGRGIDGQALVAMLVRAGYRRVSTVVEPGEFAVRNAVIDVFSPFHDDPFRIEIDFDQVETIRFFDPATQRARRNADHAWVVPAWEVPCGEGMSREYGISLRDAAAESGVATSVVNQIEYLIDQGRTPPGFVGMLPFFHSAMDLPVDYAGEDVTIVVIDPEGCQRAADQALEALNETWREFAGATGPANRTKSERPLAAPPSRLAVDGNTLLDTLEARTDAIFLKIEPGDGLLGPAHRLTRSPEMSIVTAVDIPVANRVAGLKDIVTGMIETGEGLLLLAPSEGEAGRVREILQTSGLAPEEASINGLLALLCGKPVVRVGTGRIRIPFGLESWGVFVLPTESVFGVKDVLSKGQQERRNIRKLQEFRELSRGDMVIHRDHGMGIFEGMTEVAVDGVVNECLLLTYKGGDRLYVPVDRANLLDRYTPPAEGVSRPLDRLGTGSWSNRKVSARRAARNIAASLKKLYARRMASTAPVMTPPDADFREFEAAFHWETTQDQDKAIAEILDDIQSTTPMDRLICGDVGFGKTEVAIRAAYKAISDGYQVAVLVPTTILAEQHRLTFAARFRNTPAVIESISRFKSARETRAVLSSLRTGGVDIVVGTHRLLSQDVKFMNLGLLIIDEEQRFGVAHKERLREMAAAVHTMSLTATPIPRTLHMALSGIRGLSLITTPPRDRLAVRTFVARSGPGIIRSAITREIGRGGQVYVVHNRVEDIDELAAHIASAVPEASVSVAHGQMPGTMLEDVMSTFVRGDSNVLVATTIVESGLDIGTANTMIIHDADRLGLAQLYQLRGRVGRSSEQAYCYLLVRDPGRLSGEARMRIEAIERYSDLASGFNVASMDLAIRGSGEILGAEQSGHLESVGEDMFLEMVREAMAEMSGDELIERRDTDIKVDMEARLPSAYISDEKLRLRFYKRLASAADSSDLDAIAAELTDRFGPLPSTALNLVSMLRLKQRATELGLATLTISGDSLVMTVASADDDRLKVIAGSFIAAGCQSETTTVTDRVRLRCGRIFVSDGETAARERLTAVERLLASTV